MVCDCLSRTIRRLVTSALLGAAVLSACAPAAFGDPPTVTITRPLGGTVTNERTPMFVGTGEEAAEAVTLAIYPGALPAGIPVEPLSTNVFGPGGTWTLSPLEPLADGIYTAQASQTNGSGTGSSLPVTFTVLTSAPVVTISQPAPAPGETAPSFTGTASDTTPVSVQIHAGDSSKGTLVSSATAAGTGARWQSSPANPRLPLGTYTAVAVQRSSLTGNPVGHSDPVTFAIAPVPPAAPAPAPPSSGVAAAVEAKPKPLAPLLLAPFPVVRVAGVAYAGGVRVRVLSVQQAPAGALVRVRCRGHGCPAHGARKTTVAGPHGVQALVFRSFERFLRAGAVIEVFVTKPGTLGKYTRLRVRRGRLPERVDLCLDAAGVKPIACPAS